MTDRELLEFAAKAAGIKFHSYIEHELIGRGINIGDLKTPIWNPLDEDGAALRLAVKLRLDINIQDYGAFVRDSSGRWHGCEAHIHGGIEMATRRSIVLCAASIGKAMP